MGMGIGHKYLVQQLSYFYGDLQSCLEFMKNNPPKFKTQWYELRPDVKIRKGKPITCDTYFCLLLTQARNLKGERIDND